MATVEEARRIVMLLMKRPITEEIAIEVKSIEGYEHLEIADGQWVGLDKDRDEMSAGEEHGWIESLILHFFMENVVQRRAGRVYPGDTTYVLSGDPADIENSREPDVSFVAQPNVVPTRGYIYGTPDLAVEIISPSQSLIEMRLKVKLYLSFGTRQVWLVIPATQEIEVYLQSGDVHIYGVGDTITVGDLLPGFALDVAKVFEK